jgi:hypothetical protein
MPLCQQLQKANQNWYCSFSTLMPASHLFIHCHGAMLLMLGRSCHCMLQDGWMMTVCRTIKKLSAHFPLEHLFYFKQVTTIDNLSLSAVAKMIITMMTGGQTLMADFGWLQLGIHCPGHLGVMAAGRQFPARQC